MIRQIIKRIYRSCFEENGILRKIFIHHTRFFQRLTFLGTLVLYPLFLMLSWLRVFLRHTLGLKPAILWAPTPILTIKESSNLLRQQGYPSTTLVFTTYHIQSDFDINLKSVIANPAVNYWIPNLLFLWALLKFDVFHFFYDGGLWSGMKIIPAAKWLELPLLRLAGKRVIASAYGADVRVRSLNEMWQPDNICKECPEPGKYCVCDGRGMINAKYYRDWCNEILAMGDMHDFVFGSRMDLNYWPIDVKKVQYVGALPHSGPVRVVHSPNHRYFKGTRFIESAVAALRTKGYSIELVMVEGVSNAEARQRYAQADIVFAQCLAGWIGYTEIEAMAAGKPVIGYIRNPAYLAHTPDCPLVSANPATLETELENLLKNPDLRYELGIKGRKYVECYWSYEALALQYDALHQKVWHANRLKQTLRMKRDDFFQGETRYRVGNPLTGVILGEWVIWSDPVLNMNRIQAGIYGQPPFDENNTLRVYYDGRYVDHPGAIGLYAMNAFHNLLAEPQNTSHRQRFLEATRWLRDHLVVDDQGVGRWFYDFPAVGRDLPVPWMSCFSQSIGLSMLLRADQISPGEGFMSACRSAAQLFRVPVASNGVLWEENDLTYLEEYPEPAPAHVLNGFITGMFGLYEYYRVSREAWAQDLFYACMKTVKQILGKYETPGGLRYDLRNLSVVNADYYYFQVQQLFALYAITSDPFFESYAHRWRRQMYRLKIGMFLKGSAPL